MPALSDDVDPSEIGSRQACLVRGLPMSAMPPVEKESLYSVGRFYFVKQASGCSLPSVVPQRWGARREGPARPRAGTAAVGRSSRPGSVPHCLELREVRFIR